MVRRMAGVIEIEGLRKEYRRLRGGRTIAVDGLDLEVPEGGVFGFLGPNGAGKTTTIRCLLGLVAPSAGTVRLLGSEVPKGLPGVIGKVGAIVETPALFPRFSGRRNLQILARIDGIGKATIEEVLTRVGLADRGDDAVKAYSLGMKQRLGIAAALMKDPQVLVLDEPANGLDPAGIVEVRELVRSLGAEGRTVFISSHILSEIQHTADQVAILAKGRLIKAGPVHEVLVAQRGEGVIVKTKDLQAGLAALTEAGLEVTATPDALRVAVAPDDAERISRTLAERGLYVTELRPDEVNLETVFLELTADEPAAPMSAGES
jgi:ABC-2 type transport system ATP-binding protein